MNISSILTRALGTAAAIAAVSFCSLSARAGTVYSNNFPTGIGNNSISGLNVVATGFTTGTNPADLTIGSVTLALAVSGTSSTATPLVQIYSGVGDPTTAIATLTGTTVINNVPPISYTFNAGTPVELSPNTNYWIVAQATEGAFGWYFSNNTPSAQNSSGYQFLAAKLSTNGGSTYSNDFASGASYVSVQAIPEPSTLVLAGIGITTAVTLDTVRRRRRKARAAIDSMGFEG